MNGADARAWPVWRLISGILSVTSRMGDRSNWLQARAPSSSVLDGRAYCRSDFFFGAAVALGLWALGGQASGPCRCILVTTMYAWSAAIQAGIRLQRNADDDPHLIAASLGAGRGRRRADAPWRALCSRASCAGRRASLSPRRRRGRRACCSIWASASTSTNVCCMSIWQPAVAFCIGMGLADAAQALRRQPPICARRHLEAAPAPARITKRSPSRGSKRRWPACRLLDARAACLGSRRTRTMTVAAAAACRSPSPTE